LGRDVFPFYNNRIRIVRSFDELKRSLEQAVGDVYLMIAYRGVLRNAGDEHTFIQSRFEVVKHYDGILMDSTRKDGDIYVMVSRANALRDSIEMY